MATAAAAGPRAAAMALGTVQLGLPYGAANTTGMPSEEQARPATTTILG